LFDCDHDEGFHHTGLQNKARMEESDDMVTIRMDVPGVKAHRVTIEEKEGEIEITAIRVGLDQQQEVEKIYQEILYINPNRSDVANARATLTNGVLTITIPKKSLKDEVEVESAAVPTGLDPNAFHHISTDLPGVEPSNLKVMIRDEKIIVKAKRTMMDNETIVIKQRFEIPPSVDANESRAFLQDGVFTFVAPLHNLNEDNNSTAENAPMLRTIPVVEEETLIEPSIAGMNLNDNDGEDDMKEVNDDAMKEVNEDNAETAGNSEDWEKVSEE